MQVESLISFSSSSSLQSYAKLFLSLSKTLVSFNAHKLFDKTPLTTRTSNSCKILHARILRLAFPLCTDLGNAVLDLYSKCGNVSYTNRVFNFVKNPNEASWNCLLSVHSKQGLPEHVLCSFQTMWRRDVRADQFGFAITLSACARAVDAGFGQQVHCEVVKTGFQSDCFCEGALVDMYAKCGSVADARRVFDGVFCPDTVCWTSMIGCYARVGMVCEAVELFQRMMESGVDPDRVSYLTVISACLSSGRLGEAQMLFSQMPWPNEVAWNAMISGHAQNGHEAQAIDFFKDMRGSCVKPTRSTLGSVLSAAANLMALDEGQQVHSEAIKLGFESNVFVGSSLINFYAKCSQLEDARKTFDLLDERNVVTWNAMLAGCIQNGAAGEAIRLFSDMRRLSFEPDQFTLVSALSACACLENFYLGIQLHALIAKSNLESSLFVANAIVDMYAKCRRLGDAKRQFMFMPNKDIVSWNAMIAGFACNNDEMGALNLFERMLQDGLSPVDATFATVLSACSDLHSFEKGRNIHCSSIKYNLSNNIYVASSLVDFYTKSLDIDAAKKVFSRMPEKNVVLFNALIAGLVHNKDEIGAVNLFRQMQIEGILPSEFTFASILPACTGSSGLMMGKQIHAHILKSGLWDNGSYIAVSLLEMYLKCKEVVDGNKLFNEFSDTKNLILWTAAISGHAQNGYAAEALLLFSSMHSYGVYSDEYTFASVLSACADLAALREGKEVHGLVICSGFASYEYANSCLIDMYSKCGDMGSSSQLFNETQHKGSIILWNSTIIGFAKNGYAREAIRLFHQMEPLQIMPDDVTFLGVLTACSHAGLLSEGREFFHLMTNKYAISPRVDHHSCMIDLLGRYGSLEEAENFIDGLPFEPDGVIWATLLSACRMHGDDSRAKKAALKLIELEPFNSSPYVLLSNIYAALGDWSEAKLVRKAMKERGVKKSPGCSWITVGKETELFFAGDKFHPCTVIIYEVLLYLTAEMMEEDHISDIDFPFLI